MVYGRNYEGHTEACANCAHFTNEQTRCTACDRRACANCTDDDGICADCVAFAHDDELNAIRKDIADRVKSNTVKEAA